ncbi:Cofilin/tropomyosin-type actin-binding protein [Balamuthia mandrillaris]
MKFLSKGPGGLPEFRDQLQDDSINYVVLGLPVSDQDEGGNYFSANKHIFITWVGTQCKPMVKARSSQHRRPLYQYVLKFLQLQAELQVLEPEELTQAVILEKLRGTRVEQASMPAGASSGGSSASSALAPAPAPTPKQTTPASSSSSSTSAPRTSGGAYAGSSDVANTASFADLAEANAAIEDVRNDTSPTNWVVFGHVEGQKEQLKVLGTGSDGLAGCQQFFTDDDIVYAILAQVVKDEKAEYATKKYVFIAWVGPEVKPLTKARSSQVRVALYKHAKVCIPALVGFVIVFGSALPLTTQT